MEINDKKSRDYAHPQEQGRVYSFRMRQKKNRRILHNTAPL